MDKLCDNCKFYEKLGKDKKFFCHGFGCYRLEKQEYCDEFRKKKV